jgi:8-oxo-dGTP pyrophosphatase MutT (NUDIX family)
VNHAAPPAWTVRSSRTLFRDRWLDIRADECLTGSGTELNPYYVLRYEDWVNVVAVTPGGTVVMIRQYRHGLGQAVLELPGGMSETGEDFAATALRELAEETGYVAPQAVPVCVFPVNPATHTNRLHTFLAMNAVRDRAPQCEAGEDLVVEEHRPAALLDALRQGRFGQSMHVGPILLALEAAGLLAITA